MTQSAPVLGFEEGTRRRTKVLNTIPFVDGQSVSARLDNVGYLSAVRLQVFVRIQATGATDFTGDALIQRARAILPRVVLGTNMQANIVTASAHGLNLLSYVSSPGSFASDVHADEKSGPITAAGETLWWFEVFVPVALNDGSNYTLGLLNLQNDDVSADLRLEFAAIRSLFATAGNITAVDGYVTPELIYYDVPDLASYNQPPLNYLVTVNESVDSVTIGTGEHVYPIPRGNALIQMIHQLTEGTAAVTFASPINPTGKLLTHELRIMGSTTDSKSNAYLLAHESRRRYGRELPAGVVVNDALWDVAKPGQFDLGYQIVDTAQFTKLDSILAVQGLNSSTAKLRTIRREIVRLDD